SGIGMILAAYLGLSHVAKQLRPFSDHDVAIGLHILRHFGSYFVTRPCLAGIQRLGELSLQRGPTVEHSTAVHSGDGSVSCRIAARPGRGLGATLLLGVLGVLARRGLSRSIYIGGGARRLNVSVGVRSG